MRLSTSDCIWNTTTLFDKEHKLWGQGAGRRVPAWSVLRWYWHCPSCKVLLIWGFIYGTRLQWCSAASLREMIDQGYRIIWGWLTSAISGFIIGLVYLALNNEVSILHGPDVAPDPQHFSHFGTVPQSVAQGLRGSSSPCQQRCSPSPIRVSFRTTLIQHIGRSVTNTWLTGLEGMPGIFLRL
jgi:hypothetical protein